MYVVVSTPRFYLSFLCTTFFSLGASMCFLFLLQVIDDMSCHWDRFLFRGQGGTAPPNPLTEALPTNLSCLFPRNEVKEEFLGVLIGFSPTQTTSTAVHCGPVTTLDHPHPHWGKDLSNRLPYPPTQPRTPQNPTPPPHFLSHFPPPPNSPNPPPNFPPNFTPPPPPPPLV